MTRALLFLVLLAMPALAAETGVTALTGTWLLDLEKSSNPTPALERVGVNWLIRKAAASVRTTNVIVATEEKMTYEVKSSIAGRRLVLVFDGKTVTTDDFFGNALAYTSKVEGGAIVSNGTVDMKDRGKFPLELRRQVNADGTMSLRISIFPPNEEPVVLLRVFNRK